jgi:hypothetical protein
MPTKATAPKTGRPAGGKQPIPKVKFWVLWEPPSQLIFFIVIMTAFAGVGYLAIHYSSAESIDRQTASGPLLWRDGPDAAIGSLVSPAVKGSDDSLQNWRASPHYVYGGATVKVVPDSTKTKAIEFFGVANGGQNDGQGHHQRAEQVADLNLKKGSTYWFGFDLFVSSGGGVSSGRQAIWQILSQPATSPSKLWLALNSNQEGLAIETDGVSLPIGSVPDKAWSRLVMGVHVDDNQDAWIEVWRDGALVAGRQSVPEGVIAAGASSGVMTAGLYRTPQPWDLSLRMANFKIASDRDAVQ